MSKIIKILNELLEEEFVLIEMQGSISHNMENKFYNMHLGKIEMVSNDVYKFVIGNHHLLGKKIELKNPILVCKKEKISGSEVEMKIQKIIKSKILFSSRPTPIINIPLNA